ncbi:hypothetical protein [Nocardioides ungokensis]
MNRRMIPPRVTPLTAAAGHWSITRIEAALEQLRCQDCDSTVDVLADTIVRGFVITHSRGCPWLKSGRNRGDVVV